MPFELSINASELAGRRADLFASPAAAGNWLVENCRNWDAMPVLVAESDQIIGTATFDIGQGIGPGYIEFDLRILVTLNEFAPEGSLFEFKSAALDIQGNELVAVRVFDDDQSSLTWSLGRRGLL